MTIRALLALYLAASAACAATVSRGERAGEAEIDAFGCYASTAGWLSFGDPGSADTVVRSWLVLDRRPAGKLANANVARFLGWHAGGEHAGKPEPQLGFWRMHGDSIHVFWHNGLHGVEMDVLPAGDALRGSARSTSDLAVRDSAGVAVPITSTKAVRATRVPCAEVPPHLERPTRALEPFFGMEEISPA